MVPWRFSLKGHAGMAPLLTALAAGGPRRVGAGLIAMVSAVSALWLLAYPAGSRDAEDARRGKHGLDDPAERPSLLTSAMARVHGGPQGLSGTTSSGLSRQPISEAALQNVLPQLGRAEARLIDIYRLIGEGHHREALARAEILVNDHPNFHLAHLVHGDLLTLQTRPVRQLGDVPDTKARAAAEQLAVLRDESHRRLRALTERPPEGSIPAQFMTLSRQSRHAIAIDSSRSRLYLFENLAATRGSAGDNPHPRLRLLGDYYISVGLSGIEKSVEGDKRTPLGVYYITSNLNPSSLPDFYGAGALPINYPNQLDVLRGKTGSGIWLHGTPREQFVRAPQSSDGCVVLSNQDLERLLATVQIRTTPVVIAPELQWVRPDAMSTERERFERSLEAWRHAKSQGDLDRLKSLYSDRFQNQGRGLNEWWPQVEDEIRSAGLREVQLKELSLLRWQDAEDTMVVTFGEVEAGKRRGVTKRQYWTREHDQWKIFFEGTL